jgi:hypothetical protein
MKGGLVASGGDRIVNARGIGDVQQKRRQRGKILPIRIPKFGCAEQLVSKKGQ